MAAYRHLTIQYIGIGVVVQRIVVTFPYNDAEECTLKLDAIRCLDNCFACHSTFIYL